ncbi:MAG: protein kinase, partial [Gemmatimonadetes bacterium]|nr:protein kinase [Gemmatimonadota bacterium]
VGFHSSRVSVAEIERLNVALEGRYRIVRELGRGGMATVYLADDLRHPRQVAVKVLRPDLAAALGGDRFLREIEFIARLEHPHILTLIDSGNVDGLLYYAMPYVEGESLRTRVEREGALPVDDAVRILKEVVDALAYAHSKGIVHRDIKPDNVLLSGRHAEVTDFGVAKAVSEAAHDSAAITSTGMAMGTPSYMAPEQAAAEPNVDHRADIYAVGVMAYELLAGRPPFPGATAQQVLAAHMTEAPDPLDKHRHNLPPGLAECVDRCLEKNPADRWQSADELLRRLDAVTTPSLGTIPIPAVRRKSKTRRVAIGAAVVLVGAVGWLGRSWFGASPPGVVVDPQAVAVIPFRSRGADPALSYLREGLPDLFDARLTGGGGLRSVAPQTVISGWRRVGGSDELDITQPDAVALAARLGAGNLILGGIVGSASGFELNASLISAPDGRELATASVTGPQDSVAHMVDRLAALLLVGQGGEVTGRQSALTDPPLAALRAYLDGRAAYRDGRYIASLQHYRQALEIDSTFALAAVEAVFASHWASLPGWSPIPIARGLRERLGSRDSVLLDAADMRGTYREWERRWNTATTVAPDRPEVWYELGDIWFHRGALIAIDDPLGRAKSHFHKALDLDPTFAPAIGHLMELAATAGDTAEVRRLLALYLSRDKLPEHAGFLQWRAAHALGDEAALDRLRDQFSSLSTGNLTRIAGTAVVEGVGVADGARAAAILRAREGPPQERRRALRIAASFDAATGHLARYRSSTDDLLRLFPDPGLEVDLLEVQLWDDLFGLGDSVVAAAAGPALAAVLWADVPTRADEGARLRWLNSACLVGLWSVRRRRPDMTTRVEEALARHRLVPTDTTLETLGASAEVCEGLFRAVVAADGGDDDFPLRDATLDSLVDSHLSQALWWTNEAILISAGLKADMGDLSAALATVRRRYHWWPQVYAHSLLPASLRLEGRLATEVGDTAGAIRAYQHYLALRYDPDPQLQPEADEVRAELARLLGER